MSDDFADIAPFDQTEEPDYLDYLGMQPVAFYDDDAGLIHISIDCAEGLVASYRNMGEHEPPSAQIDLIPENAQELRDWLTRALAAWRKSVKGRPPPVTTEVDSRGAETPAEVTSS